MPSRTDQYKVVINHEEQYSIIPIDQTMLRGYRNAGVVGDQKECLAYIEEVWTDMKPADKERLIRSLK